MEKRDQIDAPMFSAEEKHKLLVNLFGVKCDENKNSQDSKDRWALVQSDIPLQVQGDRSAGGDARHSEEKNTDFSSGFVWFGKTIFRYIKNLVS